MNNIQSVTHSTKKIFYKQPKKEESVVEVKVVKVGGQAETLFTTPSAEDAEYIQQKIMLYLAEL